MPLLTKDDLLARLRRTEHDYPCEALGGDVRLREISVQQRIEAKNAATLADESVHIDLWHAMIVRAGVINPETRQPFFGDNELLELVFASPAVLHELAQAILDLSEVGPNHLTKSDPEINSEG